MDKKIDINHLTKGDLWKLRQEIELNSLFTNDYRNDFGIPADKCCDFFTAFVEDSWEQASSEGKEDKTMELFDNADALYDFYSSLENPFGVQEESYAEDDVKNESIALTERQWKYTIPSKYRDALVEASDEEDGNKVIKAVSDIIEQVKLGINKIEGDDESGESEVYDLRDELESHKGESFDEMADEVDSILSDLYDLCDSYGIFLDLTESCTKKASDKLESKCVTKENTALAEDDDNDETVNSVDDDELDDKTDVIGHKAERPEDTEDKDDDDEEDETKPETDDNPLHTLPKTLEPIIEFPSGNFVYVDWNSKDHELIAGGATNTGILKEFELKYDDDKSLTDNLQDLYDLIAKKHPDYLEETTDEGGVTPTEESLKEEANKYTPMDNVYFIQPLIDGEPDPDFNGDYYPIEEADKALDRAEKFFKDKDKTYDSFTIESLTRAKEEHPTDPKYFSRENWVSMSDEVGASIDKDGKITYYVVGKEDKPITREQAINVLKGLDLDEELKEDANIKNIRSDTKEGDVRPTPEQIQAGKDDGWDGFELKHGYGVFNQDGFEIIERIDSMGVFDGDDKAEEQAKRDGFKFIDLTDKQKQALTDNYEFLNPAILDTATNRKMLADIDAKDESLSEAKDLTKIKGTISSVVSANKDAIFAAGDEIAMGKKTIDVLNKAITDKALTAGEEGHAKLWIKKLQDSIARNKKSAIAGSITTLATGTVIQKQDESIDKPDASATVTEDKKEEEKPTMDKKTLKAKLLDVTSGSDEFTDEAINAVDNIIDEAEDGQDLSDLVPDEVDRACIYYKDCWEYLEEANITEWEEAFKEGYGDLVGVTTYFLQNEIYELLGEIQK